MSNIRGETNTYRLLGVLLVTTSALALMTSQASAQVIWTGNNSSSFSRNGNWSPASAPGAADTVTINSGSRPFNPTVDSPWTIDVLDISAGTLTLGADLVAATSVLLSGTGTIAGTNSLGTTTFIQTGGVVSSGALISAGAFEVTEGTFAGMADLAGTFTKSGTGRFVLKGAVSQNAGAVAVNAGTLELHSGLSDRAWSVAAGAVIDLQNAGPSNTTMTQSMTALDGAGTVTSNGISNHTLTFTSGSGHFSGLVEDGTSTMNVSKSGTGTQILSGANTYTGATNISMGTLQVRNSKALGTADGYTAVAPSGRLELYHVEIWDWFAPVEKLYLGGTLAGIGTSGWYGEIDLFGTPKMEVDAGGTMRITNVVKDSTDVPGSYMLTKTGAGKLLVSGALQHTGGTTISAGTLELSVSGSMAGNVANSGTLVFNQIGTKSFGGQISGSGAVDKLGTNTLTLSATNTYTGATTVSGGILSITGAIADSAVTVNGGGRVQGTGTVGSTNVVNGTISGGTSIGTLNINGSLDMGAGSTLDVEVRDGGNTAGVHNDVVAVSGTVTIDSAARVKVRASNGTDNGKSYATDTRMTILTSSGRTGTFGSVTDEFAFLDASLTYDASNAYVTLTRNDVSLSSVASTPNQAGAASALSAFDSSDPVSAALLGLTSEQAQAAYESASGDAHAAGQAVLNQTFAMFGGVMGSGGSGGSGAVMSFIDAGPQMVGPVGSAGETATPLYTHAAWLSPMAARGSVQDDANGPGSDWAAGGLATGYEWHGQLGGNDVTAGVGVAYNHTYAFTPSRGATTNADGAQAGIFGSWTDGEATLAGSLDYGVSHVSSRREIGIGALTRTATANYWMQGFNAALKAGYAFELSDSLSVGPIGGLALGWSGHSGFSETGAGNLDATVSATGSWRVETAIGGRLAYELMDELELSAHALWLHNFGDASSRSDVSLAGGGGSFEVLGPAIGRDRLEVGAGLAWSPDESKTVSVNYTGRFLGGQTDHSAKANLALRF